MSFLGGVNSPAVQETATISARTLDLAYSAVPTKLFGGHIAIIATSSSSTTTDTVILIVNAVISNRSIMMMMTMIIIIIIPQVHKHINFDNHNLVITTQSQ